MSKQFDDEIIRKRRATQQYILEHPGVRMPIQHGDLSGIDPDTGWDYALDGKPPSNNPSEVRSAVAQILKDGKHLQELMDGTTAAHRICEINESVEVATTTTSSSIPNNVITESILQKDGTRITRQVDMKTGEVKELSKEVPPKLPDGYKGVRIWADTSAYWEEAQILSVNRPDLDMIIPKGLPPDVLNECVEVVINKDVPGGDSIVIIATKAAIDDPTRTLHDLATHDVIFTAILPKNSYSVSVKGRRL